MDSTDYVLRPEALEAITQKLNSYLAAPSEIKDTLGVLVVSDLTADQVASKAGILRAMLHYNLSLIDKPKTIKSHLLEIPVYPEWELRESSFQEQCACVLLASIEKMSPFDMINWPEAE